MPASAPALALLELESLARGVVAADALIKKANVRIAINESVSPGKYLLVFTGEVAEIEESFAEAVTIGGALVLDKLLLTYASRSVVDALFGRLQPTPPDSALGLIETHTVAAAIRAADVAVKRAKVALTHLQLAKGIGGKGFFTLAGELHDVEAAVEGAVTVLEPHLLVAAEIIQRPHRELPHP